MRGLIQLDSYFEWNIERIRANWRGRPGSDAQILLAILDSVLKQHDVEITGGPAYMTLTEQARCENV